MKLSTENLYLQIIQNAASNAKTDNFPSNQVDSYIEGIVSASARIFLDILRNQGQIENYTVTWARTNEVITDLIIQIQETVVSQYTVFSFPRRSFSREIMKVAEVMMV
jgi:hypothetical protein